MTLEELEKKAKWVRLKVLETVAKTKKGHIGGTYSCVDLLVSLYYGGLLRFNPSQPKWPHRDRLLIGKGHACLGLFSIFLDLGILSEEFFNEYGRDGGRLGGQLDVNVPGVEYNTGSLGHVLGIGAGMALAAKMNGQDYRVYSILGDAECFEGSIWEAILFASKHRLNNLVGVIDRNRLSVTERLEDEEIFGFFKEKLHLFDWECYEMNGHSIPEILSTFEKVKQAQKPVMIVANTIKGKGVSFMENGVKWHHSIPTEQEVEIARQELSQ